MTEPRRTLLAVTEIKDVCFVYGCRRPVTSAAVYRSNVEHDVVTVWLCTEHGATFETPPDATTDVLVQETSRTCRRTAAGGRFCGAYATHVVLVGTEYEDRVEIRLTSSCARHAADASA